MIKCAGAASACACACAAAMTSIRLCGRGEGPPTSNGKLRGWWDGDYVENPREEVTLYDFGYPLSPLLLERVRIL